MHAAQKLSFLTLLALAVGGCAQKREATVDFMITNLADFDFEPGGLGLLVDGRNFLAVPTGPSVLGVKLMAAYLLEDLEDEEITDGRLLVYLNPACDGSIAHCDASDGTARDGEAVESIVTDWTDLTASSSDINASLGATELPALRGKYRYLRLVMCRANDAGASTLRWAEGLDTVRELEWSSCELTSARLEKKPLEISAGEKTTVEMVLNYSEAVSVGSDAEGEDCVGSGAGVKCFTFPAFSFRAYSETDATDETED